MIVKMSSNAALPAKVPRLSPKQTPMRVKKRDQRNVGEKAKAENSSPKPQLNWSVPMTESLLLRIGCDGFIRLVDCGRRYDLRRGSGR